MSNKTVPLLLAFAVVGCAADNGEFLGAELASETGGLGPIDAAGADGLTASSEPPAEAWQFYTTPSDLGVAAGPLTVIDFDALSPGDGTLVGDEFVDLGVTISHLGAYPMNIVQNTNPGGWGSNFITVTNLASSPNAISASIFTQGASANIPDEFEFDLDVPVLGAGVWIGNLGGGGAPQVPTQVVFLDEAGAPIAGDHFTYQSPGAIAGPSGQTWDNRLFVGLSSDTPVSAVQVLNGPSDADGVVIDDFTIGKPALTEHVTQSGFADAIGTLTVVDFDDLAAGNGAFSGTEYASVGLTVNNLDGLSMNVVQNLVPGSYGANFVTEGNLASAPNAMSTSIRMDGASASAPDQFEFVFSPSVDAAGVVVGNLGAGVATASTVEFYGEQGQLLRAVDRNSDSDGVLFGTTGNVWDNRAFYGIVSELPVASMRVLNGPNDSDGITIDDVSFGYRAPEVHTTEEDFATAMGDVEIVDFDDLTAGNESFAGTEYAGLGVTVTNLDGLPMHIVQNLVAGNYGANYVTEGNLASAPNAMSTSVRVDGASASAPDRFEVVFDPPVAGAGVVLGNLGSTTNATSTLEFYGPADQLLHTADLDAFSEGVIYGTTGLIWDNRAFLGINGDIEVARMRILNGPNDSDGITVDNITFATDAPPVPVADPGGPYDGDEAAPIQFDGSGSADVEGLSLTYTWDFGDGTMGQGVAPTHAYDDDGVYDVTLTVESANGISESVQTQATIANLPPALAEPQYSNAFEGAETLIEVVAEERSPVDVLTYSFDCGDGPVVTPSPSHICVFPDEGRYPATVVVWDDDGGTDQRDFDIFVQNVAPTFAYVDAPTSISIADDYVLAFETDDPGVLDVLTCDVNWGDGSPQEENVPCDSPAEAALLHDYPFPGQYELTITVFDGTDKTTHQQFVDVVAGPPQDPGPPPDPGPPGCAPNQTECGGECVNTKNDPLHCGGCSLACGPGWECKKSACEEDRAWEPETELAQVDTNGSIYPQVSVADSGDAIVIWTEWNGATRSLWQSRYSVQSDSWSPPQELEEEAGPVGGPRIAGDGSGSALVVWSQYDGVVWNNWARLYDAAGGVWRNAVTFELDSSTVGSADVALAQSGDGHVAWIQTVGGQRELVAAQYDGAANAFGSHVVVGGTRAVGPRIAVSTNGDAAVTWREAVGNWGQIHAARYDGNASSWGQVTDLTNHTGPVGLPEVAGDDSGMFIVVWDERNFLSKNVYGGRYEPGMGAWLSAQTLENEVGDAASPRIAMNGSGTAVVAWRQGTSDVGVNRLVLGSWGSSAVVDTSSQFADVPDVAVDWAGNAVVVWPQGEKIRASRLASVAGTWSEPVLLSAPSTKQNAPGIGIDANGDALVVWQELRSVTWDVYAAHYR